MINALIAGERDPVVLADLAKKRLRLKTVELRRALVGRFGEHHASMLRLHLTHIDHLEMLIEGIDSQIDAKIAPFVDACRRLTTIPGVGETTAQVLIAEIGTDMAVFPTAQHLASWCGVCPGHNRSAGKQRSGRTNPASPWLTDALVQAAWAAEIVTFRGRLTGVHSGVVLRLRLVVRGVCPLIVRVVEVPAGASLAVLDGVLAACLGWAGEGPAVFTVRAVSYSRTAMLGVLSTGAVTVGSLGLRVGERFTWCPDVTTSWVVDVRVETVTDVDDGVALCVSGRRAAPPVWCRCPAEFYGWEDQHSLVEFIDCLSEVIDTNDPEALIGERLAGVAVWVVRDRFDKARVNTALGSLEVRSCVSSSRSA